MVMLYAVPLGIMLGILLGGHPRGLATAQLSGLPLLLLGMLLQVAIFATPIAQMPWAVTSGPMVHSISLGLVLAAVLMNLQRGWLGGAVALVALGTACNVLVITLNGGQMPVQAEAITATHGPAGTVYLQELLSGERLRNVQLMESETLLPFLGDVVPLPQWVPLTNIVSIGDLLGAAGVALWIGMLMQHAHRYAQS